MCAGIGVTPPCPGLTVPTPSVRAVAQPSAPAQALPGCALQLPALRSVLSPGRDRGVWGHGQDGADSPICWWQTAKYPPRRESSFHSVSVCPFQGALTWLCTTCALQEQWQESELLRILGNSESTLQ